MTHLKPNHDRVNEFLSLLSECEKRLYGYILSLVQHYHDADNIAQETRLRLWEQFDKYEPGTNFEGWARTIAHFQVLTYREKQGRQQVTFRQDVLDKVADEYAAASEELIERQRALLQCLEGVAASGRKLLTLVYSQGVSIKDAAAQLGRPVEGTYKSLARVRQSLQKCIEDKMRRQQS